MDEDERKRVADELSEIAISGGASGARTIDSAALEVKEELAAFCREPGCPNYGRSGGCPPHVGGPALFREYLRRFPKALVLQLEVPTQVLLSDERHDVFRLLHQIVSDVERAARDKGFEGARGFAGGACRELFCEDEEDCCVLDDEACRHPEIARESISGYGVDVGAMLGVAGWTMEKIIADTDPDDVEFGRAVGLVLFG